MIAPIAVDTDKFGISWQTIDLNDYSEEEIYDNISSFGYKSIEEMKAIYGEAVSQVVAECIAENNTKDIGMSFKTEDEALAYIEKEILGIENFFNLTSNPHSSEDVFMQECNSCGKRFRLKYETSGSYVYLDESCECEDAFSPVEGAPSISE